MSTLPYNPCRHRVLSKRVNAAFIRRKVARMMADAPNAPEKFFWRYMQACDTYECLLAELVAMTAAKVAAQILKKMVRK